MIANYHNKELVVDLLCRSFDSNGSVNYVVKQDSSREKRIRRLMHYSFELCYRFGQIHLSENKKACALTLFPDKKKSNLKTICLDLEMATLVVGMNRLYRILKRESQIKKSYATNQIVYLWFIGVHPDHQLKGMGTTLLHEIVATSIDMKRPIYLETSMPENIAFYKKSGFDIYKQLEFDRTLYLLKRDPLISF